MLYVFLPSHPAAAGIAAASLGLVLSANRIVRLAANSLGGFLSDRLGTVLGLVLSGFLTDRLGYRGTLMIYVPLTALGLGVALWVLRGGHEAWARAEGAVTRDSQGTLADLRRLDPRLLAPAYVFFV